MTDRVAAIVIGRNEGKRLERCLTSLAPQVDRLIYVDSGSTDQSVDFATKVGATVVALDMSQPFTAARARNAGFAALGETKPEIVQFIDGDCGVEPGWIAAGLAALDDMPKVGMVTGWRSEIHRDASVYNALCDVEWRRPAGEIMACGGDMMLRSIAFDEVGGMDATVIAAEDDELCVRLRDAGWTLWRIPQEMTRHDADMHSFGQWWKRAVRSGHGFAQVGYLHPDYFTRERKRVWVWGLVLPVIALAGAIWQPWLILLVLALYALSYVRTVQGLRRNDQLPLPEALHHGVFLTLSKFPNLIGMMRFHARRLLGRSMRIIEYK